MTDFTSGRPVVLETENFRLRTMTPEDATERYIGWLNNPEVNRYIEARHRTQTCETVRRYIERHDNVASFLFGVFTEENQHIGNYSLVTEPEHARGTVGVLIGVRDYWGQGVVLETRPRILDFAFRTLGLVKVSGGCYSNNRPAIYNFRRQGWKLDGIRKSHVVCDGRRVDAVHFAMFRDDWLSRDAR